MGRTRMERTDGQGGDYMLPQKFSGSIKKVIECGNNLIDKDYINVYLVDPSSCTKSTMD